MSNLQDQVLAYCIGATDAPVIGVTLFMEALAHDEDDARAIAGVILNRTRKGPKRFKKTARENCLDPAEFSCWQDERNLQRCLDAFEDGAGASWLLRCMAIAREALDTGYDPTGGCLHYYARTMRPAPWWATKGQPWRGGKPASPVYETRGHYFFNDIDGPPARTPASVDSIPATLPEFPRLPPDVPPIEPAPEPDPIPWWQSRSIVGARVAALMGAAAALFAVFGHDLVLPDAQVTTEAVMAVIGAVTAVAGIVSEIGRRNGGKPTRPIR